jgi:anti-sigma regulatory factor (Ser/Thr protein kinase)
MDMRFRREMAELPGVLAMSEEFCRINQLASEQRSTVDFMLEELFTNAVKYGSRGGEILLALDWRDGELRLALTDFDSERFDLRDAPDVDIMLPLEKRTPGGLGIHLIRKLADRIEYDYHDRDRVGRITIVKRLG